jgi:signal peptidase II
MQKVNRPFSWRNAALVAIVVLVVLADQLTKAWIRSNLAVGQSLFDAGFFRVIHVYNTGAIFGLFKGHTMTLTILALVGMAVILVLVFLLRSRWPFLNNRAVLSAIALVIGGTIGNQIDRLFRGAVTDFLDFKVWPAFNVADSAVTVGCAVVIFCLIFMARHAGQQE